jgi:dTDP-4-amino-4,6-dideoxygalactose transaminase
MAVEVGPGDEVITTPFSFIAAVEAICILGAKPVLVDIDPRTYNLAPEKIPARISAKTKAIIPVHLYGQPAEMDPILSIARDHGLKVVEDAAQAIGAQYKGRQAGTIGDIGCLSFYPTKSLAACGDGGAILTNDAELAERCRMITEHGSKRRYHHEVLGINSRLDSLQAAILNVKLQHLRKWTEARIRIAQTYEEALRGLDLILPYCTPHVRHVYHQFAIRTPGRDLLQSFLKGKGISTGIHYPVPIHHQPAYKDLGGTAGFPVSEGVAGEILCLPIFPELNAAEIEFIVTSVREFRKHV